MKAYRPHIILSFLSLAIIALLFPLFNPGFMAGHDNTSHYIYSLRLAEMIREGNFRLWLPDFSMGMPMFYYYQPIPHLLTALVFLVFSGVSSLLLMKGIVVVLFALLPWSIYKGLRWMEVPQSICLISASLALVLQSWIGIGFELKSILGWGLYAQLWGMVLTPLAIGYTYNAFFHNRQLFGPVTFLGLLMLTHVISGLIACMSVGLLIFLNPWNKKSKLKDTWYLLRVYLGAFAISAMLIVPTLLGGDYISGYFKLDEEHHLGMGLIKAVEYFFIGNILDYKRLPVLTLLTIGGIFIGAYKWSTLYNKKEQVPTSALFIALNLGMAFFLIAGAKTFTFLQYTPLYNNLPFLRLLGHLHFFCLPVIGFTLVFLWDKSRQLFDENQQNRISTKTAVAGLGFLLIGIIGSFLGYKQVQIIQKRAKTYNVKKDTAFEEAITYLKALPDGRVNPIGIGGHKQYLPTIDANKPIARFYAAGNRANLGQFYLHKFNNQNPDHYQLFGYPYLLTRTKKVFSNFGDPVFQNQGYKIYKTGASTDYFDIVQSNTVVHTHNQAARHLFDYWLNHKEILNQKNHISVQADHQENWFENKGYTNFMELIRKDKRLSASRFIIHNKKNTEQIESVVDMADEGLGNYLNYHAEQLPADGLGHILKSHSEDGYYEAELEVCDTEQDKPAWAMVKVNAHPDWKATVNGEPAEWVQMSPCFMAVQLPPGRHKVAFEFQISGLRKALFFLALFTIIGLGILRLLPKKTYNFVNLKLLKSV